MLGFMKISSSEGSWNLDDVVAGRDHVQLGGNSQLSLTM